LQSSSSSNSGNKEYPELVHEKRSGKKNKPGLNKSYSIEYQFESVEEEIDEKDKEEQVIRSKKSILSSLRSHYPISQPLMTSTSFREKSNTL
jgi:hypothetical protein